MSRGVALAAVLAALSPAAAQARQVHARLIGTASSFVGTDGTRFAAWQTQDGATLVYDRAIGRTVAVHAPAGCAPAAVGAGALLASCTSAPFMLAGAQLLNLQTGLWRTVVAPGSASDMGSRAFVAVGRRWLEATLFDADSAFPEFFSRADGSAYAGPSPFGRGIQPDLDASGLRRRACAPLAGRSRWSPLLLDGRDAVDRTLPMTLMNCGSPRRQILCRRWCFTPLLRDGQVLWADDFGRLHVRGTRARRTRVYTLAGHTIDGVYALGPQLVFTTDYVAGIRKELIRVASARALRRP